ncbi:PIN-like domain-containing protein [Nostoc sp. DedSLP04]|uniref:PIN-like domain-containing protein n=1 Tax=Nostoc sp. DedSLP04 TaxID=3075401 RepID=UPI002AD44A31|nr:PIN-like domain-containing protein [Nostoc sp. DedSLP04]MDZ8035081.1 PIN-like domain-containing protein [Nostoc sp. DedSLP04]
MKELFSGYYRPSEIDFQKIWQSATFVLDANILLNMYRYPEEARRQLFTVLQSIAPRLWVPYQAALEFQRNRLTVIAEQKKRFSDVRKVLDSSRAAMISELEKLQLKKRHSSIQADELVSALDQQITDFLANLDQLEATQLSVTDSDPIREQLDQLLKEKVGESFSQEEITKIYQEGEIRFKSDIPPGYKDQKKETDSKSDIFSYGGVIYQRKYGDLVLWKQIINKASQDSIQSIVFLTDDEKEDWWWITDSQGKNKIGPRPELVNEISREAGTKLFYMYNSEQFLKYSKEFLNTNVTDESISQVREVVRASLEGRLAFRQLELVAAKSVLIWLQKRYANFSILENKRGFPDYIVRDSESERNLGFEIKIFRDPLTVRSILRDQKYRGYYETKEGSLDEITFVFVMQDEEVAHQTIQILEKNNSQLPPCVNLIIGVANLENEDDSTAEFYLLAEFNRDAL